MFQVTKCRATNNILYNVIYICKFFFFKKRLIKYCDILSFIYLYLKKISYKPFILKQFLDQLNSSGYYFECSRNDFPAVFVNN